MRQIPIDPHNQSLLVYGGEELHQIPRDQILLPFGRRAIWFTEDPARPSVIKRTLPYFTLFLPMILEV